MEQMREIDQWLDSRRGELVQALQGAVRIPSVYAGDGSDFPYGAQTARCLAYMLELARGFGLDTRNMDNHLGWCEYGQGTEMTAVLCHLDVVPAGGGWTVPPFEGVVLDGRLYGRGAMDDKGPAVAALYALAAVKAAGLPLRRRVRILFGLDEESGSGDMAYYLSHGGEIPAMGFTPDGMYPVINGEKGLVSETYVRPLRQTGTIRLAELEGGEAHNIVPARARARLLCAPADAAAICALAADRITCTPLPEGVEIAAAGVGAHGGSPWEGENALGRLMIFLDRLPLEGELREAVHLLAARFGLEWDGTSLGIAQADEPSGKLTMNLGTAGWDGTELTVRINYRYPVTRTSADCAPQIRAVFEAAGFRRTQASSVPPLYMAPDSPLVTKLMKVYRDCTGDRDAVPLCIGGGTYAKSMPNTLAFGPIFPGDEVREHKPDEFIELDRLMDNARLIAAAIYELAR